MIIYKDIITNDELFSDTLGKIKEVDGVVYEVEAEWTTAKDVDYINIGANPSAEGGEEQSVDPSSRSGLDVVLNYGLEYLGDEATKSKLFSTKKAFLEQLKKYMKSVKDALKEKGATAEEIEDFQTRATNFYSKKIVPNFKNYDFYTGKAMSPDGMVILLEWRDDETIPILTYWKHGIVAQKC